MKRFSTLIALAGLAIGSALFADEAKKPNIIFVLTDDQGYGDLACHGHPFLKTPNLDKLHGESTRMTNYHVSPTCAPTRAALFSGKNPFEVGVTHTIFERERMALGVTTLAEVLKEAGYKTGIFGKWHLGEEDPYQPSNRGFDESFIHGAGGIGQRFEGSQGDVPGNKYFDPTIRHNGQFVKTEGFCTDVFFQQALGWMKEQKEGPFFTYIALNAPHAPFIAPEKYKAMYRKDVKGNDATAAFFGMITNIDDNMGLLMEKLDEWDLAENTLLIFMTDNGTAKGVPYYNAGMKGGKATVHEGGSRVPFFLRLPGLTKPGVDIDHLTRHLDVFPTLAELAGADTSGLELEGRSIIPLLKDKSAAWPDRKLFFHLGRWPKAGAKGRFSKGNPDPDAHKDRAYAVRTAQWRLVEQNLYNIQKDPSEKRNVAKKHPQVVSELKAAYEDFWAKVRPAMSNEDAPLDVEKPFEKTYLEQKKSSGIPKWDPPSL